MTLHYITLHTNMQAGGRRAAGGGVGGWVGELAYAHVRPHARASARARIHNDLSCTDAQRKKALVQ